MKGCELRVRRIVIESGCAIAEYSCAVLSSVVYILEASVIEHQGDTVRVVKLGDTWTEALDTVHWMENTSGKPCVS
jgi:quercetin dioxygenase-like cupin family protein